MRNLTMLTDLYQFTMMYGYTHNQTPDKEVVFDLFFRELPPNSGYAIAAGLEQVIQYVRELKFEPEDIDYLRSLKIFDEEFLERLRDFHFTGDIDAIPEGTVVFPYEPIIRVKGRIFEAQLIETAMLNIINFQTLIATKAARVVFAAGGGSIMEFGLRRAQGPDAGIYGARAAYIGGCHSTSNVLAGQMFGIPVSGTHAHSWVLSFPTELEAFRAYARTFPDNCVLLVDTYNVLKLGVPNAIIVGHELEQRGYRLKGIRIDSGDLTYLSCAARKLLDQAGLDYVKIVGSNDLDEDTIWSIRNQGAKIDSWGVGTHLITSKDRPSLGGVYKLAAEEEEGVLKPRLKVSENITKITNPGLKKVVRFYDQEGKAMADLIALHEDEFAGLKELEIFNPIEVWKRKVLRDFHTRELLVPVFRKGRCVYDLPELEEIQKYAQRELDTLWDEVKRLTKPHKYIVDLSTKLYELRQSLLREVDIEVRNKEK